VQLRGSKAPYGSRRKCENFLPLDIRQLKSHARLCVGTGCTWQWWRADELLGAVRIDVVSRGLTLSYSTGEHDATQRVEFTWTPCRFGGLRTWFVCGDCRRRCAVVYGANEFGWFSCRSCMNLAYSSEAENVRDRLTRKLLKREAKLNEDGEKPKGMWRRTYERICGGIAEVEDARLVAFCGTADANREEAGG
jgi:hypothetical protein